MPDLNEYLKHAADRQREEELPENRAVMAAADQRAQERTERVMDETRRAEREPEPGRRASLPLLSNDRIREIAGDSRNGPDARSMAQEIARQRADSLPIYLDRQWAWSRRTFGPGRRTLGLIDHIQKELREIINQPADLEEWIDVAILALDGFWRHGGKSEDLMSILLTKQAKNFARKWPAPTSEDVAVEYDRTEEAAR